MSVNRLQTLAREAAYEPDRGIEDSGPEPMPGVVREIPARIGGRRLFMATDEHGELCAIGIMEPGGDAENVSAAMYASIEVSAGRFLKAI